jgi:uncharacterized membrane protein YqhA
MLHFVLSLRLIMLFASIGAVFGAVLMFWQGNAKLAGALVELLSAEAAAASITTAVMGATDSFLFGVVLIIFAYAIMFGFVFDLPGAVKARLPVWMRIETISELKRNLVEVILIYLIVDFATDMAEGSSHLDLNALAMPLAIFLIAAALRLLGNHRPSIDAASAADPNSRTD